MLSVIRPFRSQIVLVYLFCNVFSLMENRDVTYILSLRMYSFALPQTINDKRYQLQYDSMLLILLQAIRRLGGSELYDKCQTEKQSLENRDQRILCEIFNEMNSSMREIGNLKEDINKLKEEKKLETDLRRIEQQEEAELEFLCISEKNKRQYLYFIYVLI